jgi:hypothetical protein
MVKVGGAELERVAEAVAETEGMAAVGGEGCESELTPSQVGGASLAHLRSSSATIRTDHKV